MTFENYLLILIIKQIKNEKILRLKYDYKNH